MPFTLTMPKLSPTMQEGVVAKWHKSVGDYCEADSLILDIGTDKATIEHHALDPGFLRHIFIKEGERATVGDPLAIFSEKRDEDISSCMHPEEIKAPEVAVEKKEVISKKASLVRISASPLAKKLAKARGISLENIKGSGPKGRILSRDLQTCPKSQIATPGTEIPLSLVRQVIAERLSFSKATIPHFYCSIKVDVTSLVSIREDLKSAGHSLTINDFIIKALSLSLMQHPSLRATFIEEKKSCLLHAHADIAVAVSVPGGLYTPIIFESENKSIQEISKDIKILAEKAKAGKLLPQEYMGGAFTISNLGMFGIDEFYPIINPPQVAILGVGAVSESPLVKNGGIAIRKSLTLCLAGDHRAIDGVEAAAFLKTLKDVLEKPADLLL